MQTKTGVMDFAGLQKALDGLDVSAHELVVDFSSVRRIEPDGLRAIDKLQQAAAAKSVKVVLRDVDINVYKVLKLMKLTHRLSFLG